ncbi:MAG TPA: hypothetical protein VMQ54_11685 [Steroidobacteraceae bacterium]|nr:hypothetical protein [Steroidobacteraceae bacterium]
MEAKDKIAVLLEEYKSLRQEVLQRTTMLNQIYTGGGAVAAGILGLMVQYKTIAAGIAMLLAGIALVVFATWLIDGAIRVAALRLRQIEAEVNEIANHRLLAWETEYGMEGKNESGRVFDLISFVKRIAKQIG